MAFTQNSEVVLLDLNVHDTIDLVLEPAFNYDNILVNEFRHYLWKTGMTKYRMIHLNKPSNMLQPKSNCNTWNPTINLNLRPHEIGTEDYEVNGEQCSDEFDEGCLRNMRLGSDDPTFVNSPQMNAVEQAMIRQIRSGLVDDTYKIAEFGNVNIREEVADGDINPQLSPKNTENFLKMMEIQNGWWPELIARTQTSSTDRFTKVNYIDTNDGTASGNATNPANIADFLRQMRNGADPILKFWNYNQSIQDLPRYELQPALFEALRIFYQTNGTLEDNTLTLNGIGMNGVLTFNGFPVFSKPEWDMYDIETGNWSDEYGHSLIQRARFTAPENLCGIITATALANRPQSALVIEQSPSVRDKGKKFMYAGYGYGFGVAQPVLVTVGYNTSRTFV